MWGKNSGLGGGVGDSRHELLAETKLGDTLVGVNSDIFGKGISPLVAIGAPNDADLAFVLKLTEDVIAEPNVLGCFERAGMLGETNRGLAVAADWGRTPHGVPQVSTEHPPPNQLVGEGGSCNIFCLAGGLRDRALHHRTP
jgi:hypothetical protein